MFNVVIIIVIIVIRGTGKLAKSGAESYVVGITTHGNIALYDHSREWISQSKLQQRDTGQ